MAITKKLLLAVIVVAFWISTATAQIPPGGGSGSTAVGSITGLGANVATWLATPSCANLAAAVTGETGTGACVFNDTPTIITPIISGLATITQGTANAGVIASTGYSLTGSDATSMISLAGTLNTSGSPNVIDLNVTNTASGTTAALLNLRVGGTSRFRIGIADTKVTANGYYYDTTVGYYLNDGADGFLGVGTLLKQTATGLIEWVNSGNANSGTIDTMIFRKAANVVGVGTTVNGTTNGTLQGKYNSSDGTAGATTTCTIVGLTSITVKDGLITSCS